MRRTLSALGLGAAMALAAAGTAAAQYPERPIQMIVAYNPGGGTDVAARTLVPYIEKHLGGAATISVLNKPGAGGEVGFTALATAEPDGYTIGFINTPVLMTIPIEREARYTLDSFEPIGNVVYDPGVFAVSADGEIKTLDDLVAAAKERPGELTYATTGIGSDDHLAMLKFQRLTDTELQHVPFEGSAPARAALLGGHVDVGVINAGEAMPYAEEGKVALLGQMAGERWEGAADVPTFKEQGYDIVSGSARGIAAPAGTPQEAVDALAAAIEKAVMDPEFRQKAEEQALPLEYLGPQEYQQSLEATKQEAEQIWADTPWVEKQ
jgi:tripartite-type tricarboxylate transporter receptor subunit TctC